MKFTCNKNNIKKAVSLVNRVIGSHITMPIFSNIYIEAADNMISFCGSDNELFMKYSIEAHIDQPGKTTVNAAYFHKAINAASLLQHDNITVEVSEDNKGVIRAGKGVDKFIAFSADSYIFPEPIQHTMQLTFSSDELKEFFDKTKLCISKDETKPNLLGICISVQNQKVKFVSTDTRRLAVIERDVECGSDFEITVPGKCVNEITSILTTLNPEQITLKFNDSQINFECENFSLSSRLIGEPFPDYREVIPQNHKIQVEVNTSQFKNAVEYIMHNAENNAYMTKLEFCAQKIVFSARSRDTSTDSTYEIDCVRSGEEDQQLSVIFNALYLKEIFKIIDTENALVQIVGSLNPCIIRPYNSSDLYIIMPVRSE